MGTPRELRLDERLAFVELVDLEVELRRAQPPATAYATGALEDRALQKTLFPNRS